MFGMQPNLPIDIAVEFCAEEKRESHIQYIKNLREGLQESYQIGKARQPIFTNSLFQRASDHSAKSALLNNNKQRFESERV